jgi:hypothetical protein
MSGDFAKELRGDTRGEAIDIYNHIDRKELKESYLRVYRSLEFRRSRVNLKAKRDNLNLL